MKHTLKNGGKEDFLKKIEDMKKRLQKNKNVGLLGSLIFWGNL